MLSNKNYPYIVKSGGLLRGRIHKHDIIKNEDTNVIPTKDKNCQRSKKRSRKEEKNKKVVRCHFSQKKTTKQLFFLEKKIYDLSDDDDDDD